MDARRPRITIEEKRRPRIFELVAPPRGEISQARLGFRKIIGQRFGNAERDGPVSVAGQTRPGRRLVAKSRPPRRRARRAVLRAGGFPAIAAGAYCFDAYAGSAVVRARSFAPADRIWTNAPVLTESC